MAYAGGGAAGPSAAYAAMAEAVKASGTIIRVEPEEFMKILSRVSEPLVVISRGGFIKKDFRYLISYKGLCFYTKSNSELTLPGRAEIIAAKEIWVPN